MHFFCNFLEHFCYPCSTFCRNFWPNHLMLLGKCHWMSSLYLLLLGRQVTFITCKGHDEATLVRSCVLFHFIYPVFNRLERVLISQVITDYSTDSIPVVHVNHWPEPFMATSVPNVHLYLLLSCCRILTVWNSYNFLQIGSTNRYVMNLIEPILAEPHGNGRLPNSTVSE